MSLVRTVHLVVTVNLETSSSTYVREVMKTLNLILEYSIEFEVPDDATPEQIVQAVTDAQDRSPQDFTVIDLTVFDYQTELEYCPYTGELVDSNESIFITSDK